MEVPVPLAPRRRQHSADEARRALGIDPAHKVVLTVGWRYKFTPYRGSDLVAVLGPILAEPDVVLLAVGPRDDDELWSSARARYGGRVHAVGRQDDIQLHLEAADVFVDSYPIASLTAALDAASFGIPVVGLAPNDAGWPRILREDDRALVNGMFDDAEAFRARITVLLRDSEMWRVAAEAQRAKALREHSAEAWALAMQRVDGVAAAVRDGGRRPLQPDAGVRGAEDHILATYISQCEDRLIRPEMRWKLPRDDGASMHTRVMNAELARIDDLLLGPAQPSGAEYDEALRIAEELLPRRRLPGAARRLARRRGRHGS